MEMAGGYTHNVPQPICIARSFKNEYQRRRRRTIIKMKSILVALGVVVLGYLIGKAMHSFVGFVIEIVNKNDRRD